MSYVKIAGGMAAVAGLILGNGYANSGEPRPDVSQVGPSGDMNPIIEEVFLPFSYAIAQAFADIAYFGLFWVPFQLFGVGLMIAIAYFGIYRVGEKGWTL